MPLILFGKNMKLAYRAKAGNFIINANTNVPTVYAAKPFLLNSLKAFSRLRPIEKIHIDAFSLPKGRNSKKQ
jgi:hypothetical protein